MNKLDIINVDPPYFEQVVYGDKNELFWVVVRKALQPVLDLLFKDRIKIDWDYRSPELPREKEAVVRGKSRSQLTESNPEVIRFKALFREFVEEY